jgi:hypothetical protein
MPRLRTGCTPTRNPVRVRLDELERRDTPTFLALPQFTTQVVTPSALAVGDFVNFNGEGKLDVAVGNSSGSIGTPAFVGIGLGNGDGTFTAGQKITDPRLVGFISQVITGDFNRDANVDLAVVSEGVDGTFGGVFVFLGKGDGTFGPASFVDTTAVTSAVATADFTGDGIPDLVAIQSLGSIGQGYQVYAGNGDGTFNKVGQPQPTGIFTRLVTGDFDADGKQDFAGGGNGPSGSSLITLYGNGDGTFAAPAFTPLANTPADLVARDFDGDSKIDVVTAEGTAAVFHRNLGGRQFSTPGTTVLDAGTQVVRVASADFDRNGLPDVVALDPGHASVAYDKGGGAFTLDTGNPYTTLPGTLPDLGTGDFDGDGNSDFALVAQDTSISTGIAAGEVFLNLAPRLTLLSLTSSPNPSGQGQTVTFTATLTLNVPPLPAGVQPSGTVTFFEPGLNIGTAPLINGTATVSISTLSVGSHEVIAQYSGDTSFRPSVSNNVIQVVRAPRTFRYFVTGLPTGPGGSAERVASGDFNKDGVPDIVLGSGIGAPARVTVVDGKTGQVFAQVVPFGGGFTGGLLVAGGDVDGDGVADLVVTADVGGGPRVQVYLTRGTDLVLVEDFLALDETFRGGLRVALGDVNHDGIADLVVAAGAGGGPRVATYDGRSLRQGVTPTRLWNDFFAFDPASRIGAFVAVGDLGGDGFGEILVGADAGGGPRVSVFDGRSLATGAGAVMVANFFSGPSTDRGGVRVAARDVDGDGAVEVVTGAGVGSGSTVRVYNGADVLGSPSPTPVLDTDAFPGLLSGVYVA